MSAHDELYALAREVLLDALDALAAHRDALVLVGAQALYLHVGGGDFPVAPFTTDGDLAIDPSRLDEAPPLELLLTGAGFTPKSRDSVGVWIARRASARHGVAEVPIDLLVPAGVRPAVGRRAARLRGHDPVAARTVRGLEGTLVDADAMSIGSLTSKERAFDVRVGGPAALLVAKVHKIADRAGTGRASDKDALDVLRLLRGTQTAELATRYEGLLRDTRSREAATLAKELVAKQFAARAGDGVRMAIRALGVLADPAEIAASCEALASDLLAALD